MASGSSGLSDLGIGDEPTCPVCGSTVGDPFVRIGSQPIHCNLLWNDRPSAIAAPRGDIDLVYCTGCGHIHNASFDAASTAYGGTYENSLHHSTVFQSYADELVADLVHRHDLRERDIVEIGAGQGDFLRMLCEAGSNRGTGFDPSYVGVSGKPDASGVSIVAEYYDERFVDHPADLIICRHVLEHIDRASDFIGMLRRVVGERHTVVFFEVPDAAWVLNRGGIWDIIYEHCGYFTAPSLTELFERSGFEVDSTRSVFGGQFLTIEAHPAHGVSLRGEADVSKLSEAVDAFARQHQSGIERWRDWMASARKSGRRAVVWGAGSKCVTFLNAVDPDGVVEHVVDLNPRKHRRFVAGSGQLVVAPGDLPALDPDAVIVMNPNYRAEIAQALVELDVDAEVIAA